jgi:release factor glutamine methyltransferase
MPDRMRPAEVVRRGAEYLERHGVDAPGVSAEELMMRVLGSDRAGVYARSEGLSAAEARAYGRSLCRRCTGTPLQHLTGEQGFRRLVLTVRSGVFIPRPETEILVDVGLEALEGIEAPAVVDLCTGSGAVALAIADEHPGARVWATDRSEDAIALAKENAVRLGLPIDPVLGDLFEPLPAELRGALDLIVANPPYLAEADEAGLPADVRADPPDALFGGPGLTRRLFEGARSWLRSGGIVAIEIGEDQRDATVALASASGLVDAHVRTDLAGRDRVVAARAP